jgi:hypothetical protein
MDFHKYKHSNDWILRQKNINTFQSFRKAIKKQRDRPRAFKMVSNQQADSSGVVGVERPRSAFKLYYETKQDLENRSSACEFYTNNVSILKNENYKRTLHKIKKERKKIDKKHTDNALIWEEQWILWQERSKIKKDHIVQSIKHSRQRVKDMFSKAPFARRIKGKRKARKKIVKGRGNVPVVHQNDNFSGAISPHATVKNAFVPTLPSRATRDIPSPWSSTGMQLKQQQKSLQSIKAMVKQNEYSRACYVDRRGIQVSVKETVGPSLKIPTRPASRAGTAPTKRATHFVNDLLSSVSLEMNIHIRGGESSKPRYPIMKGGKATNVRRKNTSKHRILREKAFGNIIVSSKGKHVGILSGNGLMPPGDPQASTNIVHKFIRVHNVKHAPKMQPAKINIKKQSTIAIAPFQRVAPSPKLRGTTIRRNYFMLSKERIKKTTREKVAPLSPDDRKFTKDLLFDTSILSGW